MTAQPFKTKVLQSTFPDYWGSLAWANQRNVALEIKATVSRVTAISGFPTVAIQHLLKLCENLLLPSLR